MPMNFSQATPYLVAILLIFLIYRRFRRNFGKQRLRPGRMIFRVILLLLLGCSLLPVALRSHQFLLAELIGALVGVSLSIYGARRTRFELLKEQLHYVPHTVTSVVVSLLFLGRLAFRITQIYLGVHATQYTGGAPETSQWLAPTSMVSSPLTIGIFFVLIGYYAYYYSWVLWKSKHLDTTDLESAESVNTQ